MDGKYLHNLWLRLDIAYAIAVNWVRLYVRLSIFTRKPLGHIKPQAHWQPSDRNPSSRQPIWVARVFGLYGKMKWSHHAMKFAYIYTQLKGCRMSSKSLNANNAKLTFLPNDCCCNGNGSKAQNRAIVHTYIVVYSTDEHTHTRMLMPNQETNHQSSKHDPK